MRFLISLTLILLTIIHRASTEPPPLHTSTNGLSPLDLISNDLTDPSNPTNPPSSHKKRFFSESCEGHWNWKEHALWNPPGIRANETNHWVPSLPPHVPGSTYTRSVTKVCGGHLAPGNWWWIHGNYMAERGFRWGDAFTFLANGAKGKARFMCHVGPGLCKRVIFEGNMGVWVCNLNELESLLLPCRRFAKVAWYLGYECCKGSRKKQEVWPVSGEYFNFDEQWSLAIGYTAMDRFLEPPWKIAAEDAYWEGVGKCEAEDWPKGMKDKNPGWNPWDNVDCISQKRFHYTIETIQRLDEPWWPR